MCAMMKRPILVFFQEILPGDVKKHQMRSHTSQTGGGARDLRMPLAFGSKIARMFPQPSSKPGVRNADVYWENDDGSQDKASIYLWRPTDVRPGEARIGRFYTIEKWSVSNHEYAEARANDEKWFYLLVLDADGKLWARIIRQNDLDGETATVRDFIKKRIAETASNQSVRGIIDFEKGKVFPE